jgi:hypothetical protein
MHPLKTIRRSVFAAGALFAIAAVGAETTTSAQALLDLLVKKGLVTPQEAAALQQEAANNAAASAAAAPAPMSPAGPVAPDNSSAPAAASPGVYNGNVVNTEPGRSPLSFKIGVADFTPVGFLDFTGVYRSTTNGGSIGTSFGGLAYSNTSAGQLSETRLSAQNSRLGLRVDSQVNDVKVLGYVEADFLGSAPTNLNVTSNSDPLRMRLYFADIKDGHWEVLAGQDWSMLTPNRKGIGAMPSDVFYTQDVDTNYQVGLVWARQPQLRVVYHFDDSLAFGVSAENPDQYVGSALTLPAGFNTAEVDNGSNGTATPNVIPDMIAKLAYDGKLGDALPFHVEVAGLYRDFKINTFSTGATSINSDASKSGYAGSFNSSLTLVPSLTLFETAFDGNGGGRYISTALGPDFIVAPPNAQGDYTIQTVKSGSGILGAEFDATPMTKLFAYYGVAAYSSQYVKLANGTYVGYGFPGESNSANRRIEEYTLGAAQTLWKSPAYGDLKILAQVSYLERKPFYIPTGSPSDAHLNMVYFDLRYDLP